MDQKAGAQISQRAFIQSLAILFLLLSASIIDSMPTVLKRFIIAISGYYNVGVTHERPSEYWSG